jgi:hypothetical protein
MNEKLKINLTINSDPLRERMARITDGLTQMNKPTVITDGMRHMAQAQAIAQIPALLSIRQMTAANERAVANLCALAQCDAATVERAVGMTYPRVTNDELLAALMVPGALTEFAEFVREFGRRVEYVRQRYACTGKFDEVPA